MAQFGQQRSFADSPEWGYTAAFFVSNKASMNSDFLFAQAQALQAEGKHNEAAAIFKEIAKNSKDPRFHIAYGVCLQHLKHWPESVTHLQRGINLKPHYCEGDARLFLAESFLHTGQQKKAIEQWKVVASMQPEYPSYDAVPNEAKRRLSEFSQS